MIVPDEKSLHWRLVATTIKVPQGHLDINSLNQKLGAETTVPLVRLVESSESRTSHSHAFISPATVSDAEDNGVDHIIQIYTYRFSGDEHDQPPRRLSDTQFFRALEECIHDIEHLEITSVTDLYYPAAQAPWRLTLLADPPRLDEFQSGIGKISLSGVKLRFSGSPHGLLESFLEISPDEDEYRCSLVILNYISPGELSTVHATVVNQAEEFARLFVDVKEGP